MSIETENSTNPSALQANRTYRESVHGLASAGRTLEDVWRRAGVPEGDITNNVNKLFRQGDNPQHAAVVVETAQAFRVPGEGNHWQITRHSTQPRQTRTSRVR